MKNLDKKVDDGGIPANPQNKKIKTDIHTLLTEKKPLKSVIERGSLNCTIFLDVKFSMFKDEYKKMKEPQLNIALKTYRIINKYIIAIDSVDLSIASKQIGKPVCAIELYINKRFKRPWFKAKIDPIKIEQNPQR